MNENEKKEFLRLESDKAIFERQEANRMDNFAKQLKNGLGESIKKDLENPESMVIHKGIRFSFKKWWKELTENFRIMFYSK